MIRYPFESIDSMIPRLTEGKGLYIDSPEERLPKEVQALFSHLFGDLTTIRRLLLLPLMARGERIGFVAAAFGHPCDCDEEAKRTLEVLGEQSAATLRAIIRINEAELRAMKLQTASDVARAATGEPRSASWRTCSPR